VGGRTVAVLGCGLDVDYPQANRRLKSEIRSSGTLVSEYPSGTAPHKHHFPMRNRIIVGLSTAVVVVEGGLRSGALVTARLALDANRSVFAVPGSLRNPMALGPNELIKSSRAALVTSFKDICDDLAPALVWSPGSGENSAPGLNESEVSLLFALDDAPSTPEAVVSLLDAPAGRVALSLARLEVRGFAVRGAQGYSLTESGARLRARMQRHDERESCADGLS
jgi:DNA processing protein